MKFASLLISVAFIFIYVGLSVASSEQGKIFFGILWGLLAAGEASRATLKLADVRGEPK